MNMKMLAGKSKGHGRSFAMKSIMLLERERRVTALSGGGK